MAGDDIVDAEWEEVPGNDGKVEIYRPKPQAQEPLREPRKAEEVERSPWLDLEFWVSLPWMHFLVLGAAFFIFLVYMGSPLNEDGSTSAATDPDLQIESPVPAGQMLSDWAQFVTGEASTSGFTLVDGEGEAGEFCSSASGASLMNFGNQSLGGTQLYDFFSWLPDRSGTGIGGAFQFDVTKEQLLAVRLIKGELQSDYSQSIEDITMQVARAAPGVVEIDGTRYHVCVL